jgi:superfamily II DNA or RNA helicase
MSDIIEIYNNLYPHQKECILKKKDLPKSLINIWCGGGKTRIIVYSIFDDDREINVIVFPSLGLINQFNNDYILSNDFMDYFKEYQCLSVCSDSDKKLNKPIGIDKSKFPNIKYTTDTRLIKSTLKKPGKKLFTVTYQSLELFMKIIIDAKTTIDRLYYDEAHHILGNNIQNIVFKNDELNGLIEKTEFYTATPDNKNGITMYDNENPENSDCGPIAYEYLFYQAVEDKVSKDFTMKLMLYPKTKEDKYINLFKSIFRECFTGEYDYWNILTFHNMVEEKDDMATVNQLSKKEKLFKKCFKEVIEEFPEMKSIYSVENVFLKGIGSKTRDREGIIKDFDKPEKGRIYLIASCKTLGEGIDTKYANMEIPINPGGSVVYEQQKLGRITRNPGGNNPNGIVLIPCWIDMEKYDGLDAIERDEMIRQELHEGGNFNTFLNVMSAYKNQCDPELWELCLKYPKMYSPKEIKSNLDKQGFKVDESKGDLIDNVNHIVDENISELVGETDEETIQNIVSTGKQVEIHSQDLENPIVTYGPETDEEPIRLFKDEEGVYHPITKKEPSKKKRNIEKPRRKKLVNVHMNDEIKVLWKIDPSSIDSIDSAFCHGVLNAEIDYNEEKWYENLENVKKYIDENKERPSSKSKNENIKYIGEWIVTQTKNHKNKKMKEKYIKDWEKLIVKYCEYFKKKEDVWCENLEIVIKYIDENKELPSSNSINEDIKSLGNWINNQKQNYQNEKSIMENEEIKTLWEQFINNYNEYFKTREEFWDYMLNKVKQYMDENFKRPLKEDKNEEVKKLGIWLGGQVSSYKNKVKYFMDNYYDKWIDFMKKYKKYLLDNYEYWYDKLKKVKKYIDEKEKIPSTIDPDDKIKQLGKWIGTQKSNYKNNVCIISEKKIKDIWEEFIEEYSMYNLKDVGDNNDKWTHNLEEVKKYINDKEKLPSMSDPDEKIKQMGNWLNSCKHNYKHELIIMKESNIRESWKKFTEEYSNYFLSKEELWIKKLEDVKKHLDINKKPPSSGSKNIKAKSLGQWLGDNKRRRKGGFIDTNNNIKNLWNEFIDEYSEYLLNNEEKWIKKIEDVKTYIDSKEKLPSKQDENKDIKALGSWMETQKKQYDEKTHIMKKINIRKVWDKFIEEYSEYFQDIKLTDWLEKLGKVRNYIITKHKRPTDHDKDEGIKKLVKWTQHQVTNYNNKSMRQEYIKPWEDFTKEYSEYFTTTKKKKDMSKKEIKPMVKKETTEQKQERFKSEMSILHQKYKTMNSQTLHKHFEDNPGDWQKYHKISEENEESFPDEEIPYKKIIEYLDKMPGKKNKDVADLGCGKARVCEHFSESERFKFINMDHVSCNDLVQKHDIKDTGLDDYSMDIVVLSLAMWGSNCKEYITEANRILDGNGVLLIIEATKRWSDEETGENKLVKLLEEKGFTIKNIEENKFMFIECIKN